MTVFPSLIINTHTSHHISARDRLHLVGVKGEGIVVCSVVNINHTVLVLFNPTIVYRQ